MKKKIVTMLTAVALVFSLSGTAWAEATSEPTPIPMPTPDPSLVYSEDLNGADGTITDAQSMLNGVYDNLPELSGGVLGFMGATVQLMPSWFVAAICLSMILSAFIIFLRFLWQ